MLNITEISSIEEDYSRHLEQLLSEKRNLSGREVHRRRKSTAATDDKVVSVAFKGRTGNQIFQITAALSYAIATGRKVWVNPKWLKEKDSNVLKIFRLDKRFFIRGDKPEARHHIKETKELSGVYQPFSKRLKGAVSLNGYFQSWKYFHKDIELIKKLVHFPVADKKYIKNKYKDLLKSHKTVSVHIRRTDYKDNKPLRLLGEDYYKKALAHFLKNHEFLIFSDDIAECRDMKFLKSLPNVTFIDEGPLASMYLMTLCDNHVIANSSFSRWGAHLSKNTSPESSGKVIAPKDYFEDAYKYKGKLEDMFLPHWIVV